MFASEGLGIAWLFCKFDKQFFYGLSGREKETFEKSNSPLHCIIISNVNRKIGEAEPNNAKFVWDSCLTPEIFAIDSNDKNSWKSLAEIFFASNWICGLKKFLFIFVLQWDQPIWSSILWTCDTAFVLNNIKNALESYAVW